MPQNIEEFGKEWDREIVVPAKENGVQSSTIFYSNAVIPDGITNNIVNFWGINFNVSV